MTHKNSMDRGRTGRPVREQETRVFSKGQSFLFLPRITLIIFLAEFLVMVILTYLNIPETPLKFLGDSIMLSVLSTPFIYLFVIKGVTKKIEAESEKARHARESAIEARGRAERMELKAYADNIVKSIPSGLLSISKDGRVLSANPSFCRIFSLKVNPTGKPLSEVLPLPEVVYEMSRGGEAMVTPIKNRVMRFALGGKARYFNVNVSPVKDDSGDATGVIVVVEDITERKRNEEKIFYLAYHDPLTGLPNRRLLINRMNQVTAAMRREGLMAAVLFLDLDRFKFINDSFGHGFGDEVIKETARRIQDSIRKGDTLARADATVARFGGDEFIMLLPRIRNPEDALRVVKRMFSVMDRPLDVGGQEVHLTLSIGVSIYPRDGDTAEELLKHADAALYEAKRMGNNSSRFYDSVMSSIGEKWVQTENRLRRAIEGEEFILHYQPQVSLATGEIIGFEALIRWQDPEDGLRGPGEFIGMAEETGLIIPIGDWVLREACRQARAWQERGIGNARVSVNISMRQFRQSEFIGSVARILEETRLEPGRLEIELTESMVMSNASDVIGKLRDLKGLGVRLAVDDFGTGYSSLAYLKLMPLDVIKIDQGFVKDLTTDENSAAIVRAVVMISDSLGVETVAEGVETEDQLRDLRRLGCRGLQGYLLSKPDRAEAMEPFLDGSWRLGCKTEGCLSLPAPSGLALKP